MSNWMKIEAIPVMTLREFAEREGLELLVKERRVGESDPDRFYAYFDHAEVMERGMLASTYGDGATPQQAAQAYADRISLKRLAINAYKPNRREIDVPRLIPEVA